MNTSEKPRANQSALPPTAPATAELSPHPTHYRTNRPIVGIDNQVTTHIRAEHVVLLDGGRFADCIQRGIGFVYGGTSFTPVSLRSIPSSTPQTPSQPKPSAKSASPAKPAIIDGPQTVALFLVLFFGSLSVIGSALMHRTFATNTSDYRSVSCE